MTYTYRFSGYFESGGVGKTGLTVTIDVYRRSGRHAGRQ